ncbi:aldo/keto reductase [Jeotgalicoccus sp. S0W5]|uniref:aldo/keto reductase n=1 Tax=Jeotgalicoccus sp. S0W5 TaxID=2527874 RepID=UPI0014151A1C|nr:aldo/keto reductase [Jeotgalicoccus sp. S0W5]
MTINEKGFVLNDKTVWPYVGLGTIDLVGDKGTFEILNALNSGFRLLDTSTNYNNEGIVGEAVRRSRLHREEILVSSKLPGSHHDYDKAFIFLQESLRRAGLEYFDKYLIHWPNPDDGKYVEAWKALVDAQKQGLIRTIGVSNFEPDHLDDIINATGVTPATNQVERHPYFNNKRMVEENKKRGVLTEAWSPFGRGYLNDVLENETIKEIAAKYDKTPAQIIINWNYQAGVMAIPKSADPEHQKENIEATDFDLSQEDIEKIDALDKGEDGRVEGQDPYEYHEYV